MASGSNLDARDGPQPGAHPTAIGCNGCESAQHIELGNRLAQGLQGRQMRKQGAEQLLEQFLFPRKRPISGRQRLVLEGLEIGRDVALGILEGLSAAIVEWHLVGLAIGDLDEEAMHAVETDLQVGNAGALAFGALEGRQKLVTVFIDAA